jgi:Protein of unknown function (DUF664)
MLRRYPRRTPVLRRHRSKHTGKSLKREVDVSCNSCGRIDLDATIVLPDRRQIVFENPNWTVRRAFLHIIEATARQAGLTDITRESIDGATLYQLLAVLGGGLSRAARPAAKA